jgi:gliding motility-associated-like protein
MIKRFCFFIFLLLFFAETFAQCNGNDTAWTIKEQQAFVGYQILPINNCIQNGNLTLNQSNGIYSETQRLVTYELKTDICKEDGLEFNIDSKIVSPSSKYRFDFQIIFEGGGTISLNNKYLGDYINDNRIYIGSNVGSTYNYQVTSFAAQLQNLSSFKFKFSPNNYISLSINGQPILNYNDASIGFQYPFAVLNCKIKSLILVYTGDSYIDKINIKNNTQILYNEDFNNCSTLSPYPVCNGNLNIITSYISPSCNNNQLYLFANGNGFSSFSWAGPNGFTSSQQNPIITNPIAGNYTVTATPSNTCFSPITKTQVVTFSKSYIPKFETISICQGQTILLGGTLQTTAGNYRDTIVTTGYCDTVKITTLSIKPKSYSNIVATVCDGQAYEGYTGTGVYTNTFTAANGCDSIRTLTLTVKPKRYSTINIAICNGQNYAGHTTTGLYIDTYIAANGCDSIRTLNLTVKPIVTSIVNQTICSGQNYFGYTTTGTYNNTYTAANGCDSIRTLNLTVSPPITQQVFKSICEGQSYLGYTATGVYSNNFITALGCDSVRTLQLTIWPRKYSFKNASICQGQTYFAGGVLQNTSGIYKDTAFTTNACDSIITTTLTVNPLPQPNLGLDKEICYGDNIVLNPGNFANYLWSNGSTLPTLFVNAIGQYYVDVKNTFGCTGSDTFNLTAVNPLPFGFLQYDTFMCRGNSVTIKVLGFNNYLWSNGSTNNNITLSQFGTYSLQVTDAKNCKATESIIVKNQGCINISIPTAFTPNGDGNNDTFKPKIPMAVTDYKMIIWNRYGQIIYETNQPQQGWDGTYKGQQQPIGAYLYSISLKDIAGLPLQKTGDVTLIR